MTTTAAIPLLMATAKRPPFNPHAYKKKIVTVVVKHTEIILVNIFFLFSFNPFNTPKIMSFNVRNVAIDTTLNVVNNVTTDWFV